MIKMQQFRETIKQRKKIMHAICESVDYAEKLDVSEQDLLTQAIYELVSAKKNKAKHPEVTKWQLKRTQQLLEKAMKELH